MMSMQYGMYVKSLNDRPLGRVTAVHACCFQFEPNTPGPKLSIGPGGVFDVQEGLIVLICYGAEIHRYRCAVHSVPSTVALVLPVGGVAMPIIRAVPPAILPLPALAAVRPPPDVPLYIRLASELGGHGRVYRGHLPFVHAQASPGEEFGAEPINAPV